MSIELIQENARRGFCYFFFFSSRRRHTRFDCDWSSDVCSSDLGLGTGGSTGVAAGEEGAGVSEPPAARRRRAITNAGGDYVDVSQVDRSQRSQRRRQRLASGASAGNAAGAGGIGVAKRAKDSEAAFARGIGSATARR